MTSPAHPVGITDLASFRQAVLAHQEIALIDLRDEAIFAEAHPLWAANIPVSRLETEAWTRIPRLDTAIVVYGKSPSGRDLTARAISVLHDLGYTQISRLEGDLVGWIKAGGEVFRDVNVPSKAFGEWVESIKHTPSLAAEDVKRQLDEKADMVIVDARTFPEFNTMSIPSATSVPGAELVLRIADLAPDPRTQIVVNCAGRTRSIIGTQSLINAGTPNPVFALRNGTIGWLLAGLTLDQQAQRRYGPTSTATTTQQAEKAHALALRAGVKTVAFDAVDSLEDTGRTLYRFDVRAADEYEAGHLPGFLPAPGGQLVQETDHHASVRGARIVLADADGVRAAMSASWLAQMGWDVFIVDPPAPAQALTENRSPRRTPAVDDVSVVSPQQLQHWLDEPNGSVTVLDLSLSRAYTRQHIAGAWFVLRDELADVLRTLIPTQRYVLTSEDGLHAQFAARDLQQRAEGRDVWVLEGGNAAWSKAGGRVESGEQRLASNKRDRYRRPYEGTDAPREAMQAYLDWEFGLIAQLERDGTHGFRVV